MSCPHAQESTAVTGTASDDRPDKRVLQGAEPPNLVYSLFIFVCIGTLLFSCVLTARQ